MCVCVFEHLYQTACGGQRVTWWISSFLWISGIRCCSSGLAAMLSPPAGPQHLTLGKQFELTKSFCVKLPVMREDQSLWLSQRPTPSLPDQLTHCLGKGLVHAWEGHSPPAWGKGECLESGTFLLICSQRTVLDVLLWSSSLPCC